MQSFRTHTIPLLAITSAVALLVSACGGGGPEASPTAPVQTGTVALSGSAATGLALGNATVNIKCAAGSGSTTTTAEGSYSVTLSNAALPCVLKVTSADNTTTYHSVAAGSGGGNVVANVTPLTELVVARATGMTPAQFFTSFTSAQSQVIAASSLQAAVAAVAQALNSALVLGEVNPLTSTLVPATPSNPNGGYAHDQLLDQLQAAITNAGTSLAGLTQIVAAPPGNGGSSLGAALESSLAASLADGFFDLFEEDQNVWVLSRAFASGAPVNGIYNVQFRGYTQSGNQWQSYDRDTTWDDRYLSSNGWVSSGSLTDGTLRQTGQNNFQFQQGGGALVENFVIQTTSPTTLNLDMVDPSLSGTVTLPSGAQLFNFSVTIGQDLYELNGGTGFGGITTLDQFRSNYGSTGNYLTWMSGGTPDQLGWRFGPDGTLLLYTGVDPYCEGPSCPVPVAAPTNGTWTMITRNGVQIMELNIPAAAGSVGLTTGEKIIYSVIPGGNVQEGIFSPAGKPAGGWTSYSRTAMNAILVAAGRLAVPAN